MDIIIIYIWPGTTTLSPPSTWRPWTWRTSSTTKSTSRPSGAAQYCLLYLAPALLASFQIDRNLTYCNYGDSMHQGAFALLS